MKNHQIKNLFKLFYTSIFIISSLIGCVKENNTPEVISESKAILAIKNIVGEKGNVSILSNHSNVGNQSMQINTDSVQLLSLKDFQVALGALQADSNAPTAVLIDSPTQLNTNIKSNSIKSLDDEEDDDRPKPAGLYRYSFLPKTGGNTSYFSDMNLSYNTGANGEIIGTPSLYFSGLHLFNWQPTQTSAISFDPITYTSSFAVTGTTTFGIQFGGFTIGWSSNITFYITIHNDELIISPISIHAQY